MPTTKPKTNMQLVALYCPPKLWQSTKRLAKRQGITHSAWIRDAIVRYHKLKTPK